MMLSKMRLSRRGGRLQLGELMVETQRLKLIVFDEMQEVIQQWKN